MTHMHAAVVTSFDRPPHYQQFQTPQPTNDDDTLVDVLAVGLHPRVRSGAAGMSSLRNIVNHSSVVRSFIVSATRA